MKYQLVLQWSAASLSDFDAMIEIETELETTLTADAEVDGHDMGMNEFNIFIFTNHPHALLEPIKKVLEARQRWSDVRIAYRAMSKEEFVVLWPTDLRTFDVG